MNIPSQDYGGTGPELLFLHANGYPPDSYKSLLFRIAEHYHVTAMVQRPLWPGSRSDEIDDWLFLTDDLLRYLDAHHAAPIACVGHSMGGIALLRAALREPERFTTIALLDPVLFPPYFILFWRFLYKSGLGYHIHPLVSRTKQRRRQFDDLERLYEGYRCKSVFRYFSDEVLRYYVESITCQINGGRYQLCYSVDWEVKIYLAGVWRDMDIWRELPILKVPALIIRGAETDTFWERTGKLVQRKQPEVQMEALERSTHLVALERPDKVSTQIHSFFEENV